MTRIDVAALIGDGSLDRVWRATLAALDGTPVEIVDSLVALAVWDVETFGTPRDAVLGAGTAADRLSVLTEHERTLLCDGRYAVGTVGGYLVARMTRGVWHVVESSTAERLRFADLDAVPELPAPVPADRELGPTDPGVCRGLAVPLYLHGAPA